jgi:hypothetical protein
VYDADNSEHTFHLGKDFRPRSRIVFLLAKI